MAGITLQGSCRVCLVVTDWFFLFSNVVKTFPLQLSVYNTGEAGRTSPVALSWTYDLVFSEARKFSWVECGSPVGSLFMIHSFRICKSRCLGPSLYLSVWQVPGLQRGRECFLCSGRSHPWRGDRHRNCERAAGIGCALGAVGAYRRCS